MRTDFQKIFESPVAAYQEGLQFFMGEGILNETLRRVTKDLENRGIEYSVIGAVALNNHGYRRFTEDIDLLLTREGLEKFQKELVGLGYRPAFEGASKKFRTTEENVTSRNYHERRISRRRQTEARSISRTGGKSDRN